MKKITRITWLVLLSAVAILASLPVSVSASGVLTNRYSFTTDASDSVSGQNGTLQSTASISGGAVQLDGLSAFVQLPANLTTNLSTYTIEAWTTQQPGNGAWARIWDFGTQFTNADNSTGSSTEQYCTIIDGAGGGLAVQTDGSAGAEVVGDGPLVDGVESHMVFTADNTSKKARLYVNGVLVASSDTFSNTLAALGPLPFVYLGHSLFSADPYFFGSIDEFRIWQGSLNQLEVTATEQAGPDTVSTNYGSVTNIVLQVSPNMTTGGRQTAAVIASASGLTNQAIDIHDQLGVVYLSGNTNILTVNANGQISAVGLGSTTISATFNSVSSTQTITTVEPIAILTHRYSFASDTTDSIGGATGVLNGGATVSGGQLQLPDGLGTTFLQLPAGVITNDTAVTIEAWATFGTLSTWANLYDFGVQDAGGLGAFDIHLGVHDNVPQTISGISDTDNANVHAQNLALGNGSQLDNQTNTHIVVVYNSPAGYMAIYINGVLRGANTAITIPLSSVQDVRNVIGADNWPDPGMTGSVDEFRIYNGALTSQQIAVSQNTGQGATNVDPGALLNLTLQLPSTIVMESAQTPTILANYANLTNYALAANNVGPLVGLTITSTDTNVVFYNSADGQIHSVKPGTASLTATYQGKTGNQTVTVVRPPPAMLAHRYSFNGNTLDSIGGANGTNVGNAIVNSTNLVLDGSVGTYLNLPGGLVSSNQAVTIECWATFGTVAGWARLFDFGSTTGFGNNTNAGPGNFFWCAPLTGYGTLRSDVATVAGAASIDFGAPLNNQTLHMVVTYDPANGYMAIYTNGVPDLVSTTIPNVPLSSVSTDDGFIGKSQFPTDPYLAASIDEFRIYNGRLFNDEIASTDILGPNAVLNPATTLSVSVSGSNLIVSWPVSGPGTPQSSPALGTAAVWKSLSGSPSIVGSNYQISVPISGSAQFFRLLK